MKVDSHTGCAAEGIFTFVLCFTQLTIFTRGPRNMLLKVWMVAVMMVGLVMTGSRYTRPSMNPANEFWWAYMNRWHAIWDLFYMYWDVGPFIGAFLAAATFKMLFPIQKPK